MPYESVTDLIRMIDERAAKILRERGRGSIRSKIDPAYAGSGDPKERRPEESATPNITKPVLLAFGLANETGAAVASDEIVLTPDGKYIVGKIGTPGGGVNASKWGGVQWVTPGNTTTLLTAATERNTTSNSYVEVKRFALAQPGRYRVAMSLARSGGTTNAKLQLLLPDGSWVDVSSVASSTSTHPTFSTHNVDMTVTANSPGMILRVVYLNTLGATNVSHIKDVSVRFDLTNAAGALYSAVISD